MIHWMNILTWTPSESTLIDKAFVLRPTNVGWRLFFFQRYALPSAPPSLHSSHLWLLQSLRRESLSHKVACSIVPYNVCGRIGFYWSLFNTACMRCLLTSFPIRCRCLLRTRPSKYTTFVRISFTAVKRLIINAVRRNVQSVCKRILAQMTNFIAY